MAKHWKESPLQERNLGLKYWRRMNEKKSSWRVGNDGRSWVIGVSLDHAIGRAYGLSLNGWAALEWCRLKD